MAYKALNHRIAYLLPLFIVYLTVEQFQLLTPFISEAIVYGIMMIILFFADRRFMTYPFLGWWLLFSVVVVFNNISGDDYFSNIIVVISSLFFIAFSAITTNYCNNEKEINLSKYILYAFLIAVIYLSLCSLVIDLVLPGVLRYATGQGYGGDASLLRELYLRGMSNYYLPHALPMLIPPIVMGIKNGELSKSLHIKLYIVLAAILVLIYVSYATTPLIFAFIFLVISIFVKQGSFKNNLGPFLIITVLFAPIILSNDIQLSLLQLLDTITGGEGELHNKINMFQESIVYGKATGDMEERFDLYNESVSFLRGNWIIGTNGKTGGHSVVLDFLASLGIVGFIPFAMLIYKQLKYSLRFLPRSSHIYYYLSMAAGLLMLLTKSMNNWEMWLVLFCIAPLLTLQLSKSK